MNRTVNLLTAAAFACAVVPSASFAQSSSDGDVAAVQVIQGWRMDQGNHMAALRITLAPGWKTYWRAPGEAGIPPVIDWAGSQNLSDAMIHFPQPRAFDTNGFRTIGYKDEVILPLELTPGAQGENIVVEGVLEIGVCQDICMPASVQIRAVLPPSGAPSVDIETALRSEPKRISAQPTCQLGLISDGVRLTAELPSLPMISGDMVAMAETADPRVWASDTELTQKDGKTYATVEFVPPRGSAMVFDRSSLRLTILGDPGEAVEMMGCAG